MEQAAGWDERGIERNIIMGWMENGSGRRSLCGTKRWRPPPPLTLLTTFPFRRSCEGDGNGRMTVNNDNDSTIAITVFVPEPIIFKRHRVVELS